MVKTVTKKKSQGQRKPGQRQTQQRRMAVQRPRQGLDAPAAAYLKLLMDPCASNLTHPIYGGGEGGYLIRSESFLTLGVAPTSTAGYLQWSPGLMGPNNTELCVAEAVSSATPAVASTLASAPGKTFLTATASTVRCVAACMRISYPGAELDRSGRLHFGGCSGSLIDAGQTLTVDQLAMTLEHYTRTPSGEIEVVWKPNAADQMFTDPNITNASVEKDRKSAVALAFAGLKAGVGLNIRFTAVYEWQPSVAQGVAVPNTSRAMSANSLDHVVNKAQELGFKFIRGMGQEMGGGMATGAMRLMSNLQTRRSGLLTY